MESPATPGGDRSRTGDGVWCLSGYRQVGRAVGKEGESTSLVYNSEPETAVSEVSELSSYALRHLSAGPTVVRGTLKGGVAE